MIQLQMINKILDTKDSSIITMNNLNIDYFSDYKDEFNYIKNRVGIDCYKAIEMEMQDKED